MCQPSGPGLIPYMSRSESALTRGNPIMVLNPTTFRELYDLQIIRDTSLITGFCTDPQTNKFLSFSYQKKFQFHL